MRWLVIAIALAVGFGAGVAAQRTAAGATMQGVVMDANTIAEEIEYWELRTSSGQSVVITGRKDLPIIQWLRRAKGRAALLTIEPRELPMNTPSHPRILHAHLKTAPFALVRGFNREHVLLAELVDDRCRDRCGVDEAAREYEAAAGPLREIA